MGRNIESEAAVKLFIAGIPSGISLQMVADFFGQFGFFKFPESEMGDASKSEHQAKGHCILLCPDHDLAFRIIAQKNFKFLGRTLTVTQHRSGIGLIVQNKRLNKCRVIFKKVPSYLTEDNFHQELEAACGHLQALFQFKPVNPMDQRKPFMTHQPRYSVYSAIFENKIIAKNLIHLGFLDLSDGSRIVAEKFQKPLLTRKRGLAKLQKEGFDNNQKVCVALTLDKPQNKRKAETVFLAESVFKPSSKYYFSALTSHGVTASRYDHQSTNLRINYRKPAQQFPDRIQTIDTVHDN